MKSWWAEIGLIFVSFVWGSTFVLVKAALDDVSTVLFLALRFSLAALILLLLTALRRRFGKALADRRTLLGGIVTGAFLYAGYLLQTLGLHHTTPAMSGFITGLYIVLVPLLAGVVFRRMPRPLEWTGVVLAGVGMSLMALQGSGLGTFRVGRGELLTVGCAFAFAVHILLLDRYSKRMSAELLSFLQISCCAAVASLTFSVVEHPVLHWTRAVIVAVLVTAVFATAIAFWVQTWAQARTTPTRAAVIFSLEPVFAWITSWALEGEILTPRAAAGAFCILAGILLVELKPQPVS